MLTNKTIVLQRDRHYASHLEVMRARIDRRYRYPLAPALVGLTRNTYSHAQATSPHPPPATNRKSPTPQCAKPIFQSQRALLESLRRHVQRGHHATPSFTAFQLIEQIFECLKTLESDAGLLPLTSPRGTPRRRPAPAGRSSTPSSPLGFPQSASPPKTKPASSADTRRTSPRSRPPTGSGAPTTQGLPPPPPPSRWSDRDDNSRFDADSLGRGGGVEDSPAGGGGSFVFPSGGSSSDGSQEKFHPRGGGEGGRDRKGTTAKFSTEWAYRLAVTKLTAQLRAARERLRGEKEASREAGERVEQVTLESSV